MFVDFVYADATGTSHAACQLEAISDESRSLREDSYDSIHAECAAT